MNMDFSSIYDKHLQKGKRQYPPGQGSVYKVLYERSNAGVMEVLSYPKC